MPITSIVYDKNSTPVTIDGVESEYTPFFRLIHATTTEIIDEPVGWGEAEMVLDRDTEAHGFLYEYINADTQLLFTCDHARHLIEEVYYTEGGDGEIFLQFGIGAASVEVIKYEGRLNLNTFQNLQEGVTCQIERKSLHEIIHSRWDTLLDLSSNKSLDNATISTVTPQQLTLHSMSIRERFKKEFPVINGQVDAVGPIQLRPSDGFFFIFPDTTSPAISEIKTAAPQTLTVQDLSLQGPLAYANKTAYSHFTFESDGVFTLSLRWSLQFWAIISRKFLHGKLLMGNINIRGYIEIVGLLDTNNDGKPDKVDRFLMEGAQLNVAVNARETGLMDVVVYKDLQINIEKGDKMIIYLELDLVPFEDTDKLQFVEFSVVKTLAFSLNMEGATQSSLSASKGLT